MLKPFCLGGSVLVALSALPCTAADFVSTKASGVILYQAPDASSKKLFVLGAYYPLERITQDKTWLKVRDSAGTLAWIEQKNTQNQQMLQIIVPKAAIHQTADDASPVVFYAGQNVLLHKLEAPHLGWVKVRHQYGSTGYVMIKQVWGL